MYVYSTGVDTKGLLYPRALQQLFVGLYIAEICLIGLVAVSFGKNRDAAIGPLILLILLLVTTALYNVALNAALEPLLKYLPKSIAAEEARAAAAEAGAVAVDPAAEGGPDAKPALEEGEPTNGTAAAAAAKPEAPPSMLTKFLKPHVYADYASLRRLMPAAVSDDRGEATGEATGTSETSSIARDAYLGPSVWAEPTRLVVPRDTAGVSGSEVRASGKVVPITDGGATLGEKNEIVVDEEAMGELWWKEKSQRMREGA
jgi:hypothetical protein